MNKSVLISNLEVLTKELKKVEREIGKEYASTLEKTRLKREITKEEFYLENALTLTMDVLENLSLLTHLLKESLGGRTKTCIIATCSPSYICYEETENTLKYAFKYYSFHLSIYFL